MVYFLEVDIYLFICMVWHKCPAFSHSWRYNTVPKSGKTEDEIKSQTLFFWRGLMFKEILENELANCLLPNSMANSIIL